MTETTLKKLNPTTTIVNSMPAIIEAFVTFYGESERENIEHKFKNLLVIGYSQPHHISSKINHSNKVKSGQLINEFLNRLTENQEEKEKLKKLFFNQYECENCSIQPIKQYIDYIEGTNTSDYNKNQVVTFLKQLNQETTIDNLDQFIKEDKFKSIDIIIPLYKEMLKKYDKYKEEIKPYKDYVNNCNGLLSNLTKIYEKKLVEELKDLFTEEEYKQIQNNFNERFPHSLHSINNKTRNYIGFSLNGSILIEAFDEKNDSLLINGQDWQQNSVKRDRIEYFKNLGLDLGDNYENYLNHPKTKEFIPSKDLIERITNTHTNLYEQMMTQYYQSLPEYIQNRERIASLELLDKEDGYNARAYEQESTAVMTNLRLKDGQYESHPILLMYMGYMEEYYDKSLIHELNHVYELSLQKVQDNKYYMICGWDILDGEIDNKKTDNNSLQDNREKRNYELFNEIINELIAQEISTIMNQSGLYIFNTEETKKNKGGTSYEQTIFLVKKFYDTYKKEIIESRKNGNISAIFNAIGKENFEAFNNLFHEYYDNFNEFSFHQTYRDLQQGIENEKTKKLKELVYKRNTILEKMEEYNKKRTPSL